MIQDIVQDLTFTQVATYLLGVWFVYFWLKWFIVDREVRSLGGRAPKIRFYLPYGKSDVFIFLHEIALECRCQFALHRPRMFLEER